MASALAISSCGGSGSNNSASTAAPTPLAFGEPVTIRIALAPDPLWEWLKDSGTRAEWESARNIRIEASSPFDQFSAFAGGHVDMVVINALDVPQFVDQSDREPLIIGKYSTDRSFVAVRRTSRAETLDDLVEGRIAVESSLGSTLLWGLIVESLHGLDFSVDSPDFELVVVEPASIADLVMRGDVEACICLPDFSVPYLADDRLRPLYDGQSAAEIYAGDVMGDPQSLPIAQAFVVDKQWHAHNTEAADALLGLWEVGIRYWKLNKEKVIAAYPHLLSVETEQEIAWMTDYLQTDDWLVQSVYINQEDSQAHSDTFVEMQRIGVLEDGLNEPAIDLAHARESGGN